MRTTLTLLCLLLISVPAYPVDNPRRKAARSQLGLRVSGRTEDHQAVNLAALDGLKLRGNDTVMPSDLETGEGVSREADQVFTGVPPGEQLGGRCSDGRSS